MFQLTAEQNQKVNEWLEKVIYPDIVAKQKKDPFFSQMIIEDENGVEHPYTGAIGGGLTYQFSPTGLGMVVKVIWYTGEELNVTDYDIW